MNVGVDEAGANNFTGHIHLPDAVVAPEAHHQSIGHGNVTGLELCGENIDKGCVFQHQVCLSAAGGYVNDTLLLDDHVGQVFNITHRLISFLRRDSIISYTFTDIQPEIVNIMKISCRENTLAKAYNPDIMILYYGKYWLIRIG